MNGGMLKPGGERWYNKPFVCGRGLQLSCNCCSVFTTVLALILNGSVTCRYM